jgi:predicted DNA binding CopG/RHH family protein
VYVAGCASSLLRPGVSHLSDYPRLTVRVPAETVERLRKLAERQGAPQWRILHDAIHAYKPEGQGLQVSYA